MVNLREQKTNNQFVSFLKTGFDTYDVPKNLHVLQRREEETDFWVVLTFQMWSKVFWKFLKIKVAYR